MKLKWEIHGLLCDFRPENKTEKEFADFIYDYNRHYLPDLYIYSPRVGFTTNVADINDDCPRWLFLSDSWFFKRSSKIADGGLVSGPRQAVAIFNGDCPIVCLQQKNKLAVLHAGFRCLIRKNPNEKGIIEKAMEGFDRNQVEAFIFGGIGPCCWMPEYDDKPEILDAKLCRHPFLLRDSLSKTTETSPAGSGHVSVDLYQLAIYILWTCGVPMEKIEVDRRCTCCAKENGQPVYWSHTRFRAGKQEVDGRNMSLAWLQ
jgi:copper oxidase (laccase) domain-containing protein